MTQDQSRIADLEAEITRLRARLAEMREALEPFGRLSASIDAYGSSWLRDNSGDGASADNFSDADLAALFAPNDQVCMTDGRLSAPIGVTWGDLRRAREAWGGEDG